MFNKSKILLIGASLAIGIVFLSIILANLIKPSSSPRQTPGPIPTLSPRSPSPKSQPAGKTKPIIQYESDRLLNIMKSRPPLATSDAKIRAKLVDKLNGKSGILNKSESYILEYVEAPNMFQIEIRATDFDKTKAQTVQWLESQGLSFEGICKLPIMFYLNSDVASKLRGQIGKFNPLPEGC